VRSFVAFEHRVKHPAPSLTRLHVSLTKVFKNSVGRICRAPCGAVNEVKLYDRHDHAEQQEPLKRAETVHR